MDWTLRKVMRLHEACGGNPVRGAAAAVVDMDEGRVVGAPRVLEEVVVEVLGNDRSDRRTRLTIQR